MKRITFLIAISIFILSCSAQSSFTKDVLKANDGNRFFMNNESIELLNKIDTASVSKKIRQLNRQIISSSEIIIKQKKGIDDIEKKRIKGSLSDADASDLTSDYEKLINKCQKSIDEDNERIILLNKLVLTNGGSVISVTRTDKVAPNGFYIPEWFIIDNNYKFVSSSKDLPFFNH